MTTPIQQLEELEMALRDYNDLVFDQHLVMDLDYIQEEERYAKLEHEGLLSTFHDPDKPLSNYYYFNLPEAIRDINNIDNWLTWKQQ